MPRKSNRVIRGALEFATDQTMHIDLEKLGFNLDYLYIDEDLTREQIAVAVNQLIGKDMPLKETPYLNTADLVEANHLPLIISTRYSVKNVPGFVQFPFEFENKELDHFYKSNIELANKRLTDFSKYSDRVNQTLKYLSVHFAPMTVARYI